MLVKLFILLVFAGGILLGFRRESNLSRVFLNLVALYAGAWILFMAYLWVNHVNFPLNLEAMELTVVQHFQRAVAGQPIYVEPSPGFVPLAYAPFYYYFSIPFAWLFGANLFTLRLVAILGMLGAEIVIFLAVKKETRSVWWGIVAVGLFTAAYRVMDTYLDNAHSDSWLLFCALLGCYLISLNKSRSVNVLGVLVLVASFWFKQHGALFAMGGVLYLTWREGWKNSLPYWVVAGALGPALYLLAPTLFFGSLFHYYTLTVPGSWSHLNVDAVVRYVVFIVTNYPALAGVGVVASLMYGLKQKSKASIWYFTLPFALLSGFMGALDPGSNNNVFIPMGAWFILTGVIGMAAFLDEYQVARKWSLHLAALGLSFALFFYNPATVIVSSHAEETYQDFIGYLNSLDGPVYAPWVGQLEDGYAFAPAVHWVPMEDLIRGPGAEDEDVRIVQGLLDPVIRPEGTAYILTNYPLENDPLLFFLLDDYQLASDLGDRFAALSTLPKRYNLEYPRYLYQYAP